MTSWNTVELRNLCSRLSSGKNIASKDISEVGAYPVYGGNGIRGYTDNYNFDGECAIIGRQGAKCGNVRYFKGKAYMTEHAVVTCANDENDTRFLAYRLETMQLGRLSGQSAQPGLSVKTLGIQEMNIPDLRTQKKISCLLGGFDDLIEHNEAINKNLEEQAHAIFDSFYEQSEREVPFTSIIQIFGGGTPKTKEESYWNGDIPFFTPKDVGSPYTLSTEKTITSTGLENCNSRLYPVNTTFVTARGTVGKVSLAGVPMAMNQSCYALAGDNIHPILTYFYTLKTVQSLQHKASGAVFDAIVTSDFKTETINKLSNDVELKVLEIIEPMMESILQNSMENVQLVTLRDTLLPRLMSGEINVLNIES